MKTYGWYNKRYIAWNIAEQLWNRELSIEGIRLRDKVAFHQKSLTATGLPYIQHRLTNTLEEITDVYTSLSVYDLSPVIAAKPTEKTEFFAKTTPEQWITAFDIDHKNIITATKQMARTLDRLLALHPEWKYSIAYSGGKGWHIETDQHTTYETGMKENKELAKYLRKKARASAIDLSIYTPRREWRCPYTIHHSGKAKIPLNLTELSVLISYLPGSLEWLEPGNAIQKYLLKNRGMNWITMEDQHYINDKIKLNHAINELKK